MNRKAVRAEKKKSAKSPMPVSEHKDAVEKDFESVADDYWRTAEAEKDKCKKIKYFILSAEYRIKAEKYLRAKFDYERAISLAEGEEKENIRKTAVKKIVKSAEKEKERGDYRQTGEAYMRAAELEKDREKKKEYLILVGENRVKHGVHRGAYEAYLGAIELAEKEQEDNIRKNAIETLLRGAEKNVKRKDYPRAGDAYWSAGELEKTAGKKMEYFSLYGDCYMKIRHYPRALAIYLKVSELIGRDETASIKKMDREKSIDIIKKSFWALIYEKSRSEVLEKLAVEYGINDAYLFVYNVKAKGKVPDVDGKIRKLVGNESNLEYLKETISYFPTTVMMETNTVELLSSNPKEFYALIRLGVIPFEDLINYYKENRDLVENRILKKTDFDSTNPLHLAVEYGRYLGMLRSLSKDAEKPDLYLPYEKFKTEINKPPEKAEMDEAEIKYLAYEIGQSVKVLKQIIDAFDGAVLIGNMSTGKYYADLMARQLKDVRMFYSVARIGSSPMHSREYYLKEDLLNKVTIKNITSVKAKPVVVVDATGFDSKIPDAFKGYISWAAGYNTLLLKEKGLDKEKIIEKISDLALVNTDVANSIYDESTDSQSSFYKRIMPWIKLNTQRKRPVKIHVIDMDNIYRYRIKAKFAYYLLPRKGIEELEEYDGDTVPMILLQPSMRTENIPAIVQEKIGTSEHSKGFLDDNGIARFMLRADSDGVSIVSNFVELFNEKISGF